MSGSADEMFAKMQGSQGADFDLVSFDTSLFPRYVDAKLIQPLDMSKLPNLGESRAGIPRRSRRSCAAIKQLRHPVRLGLAAARLRRRPPFRPRPNPGK